MKKDDQVEQLLRQVLPPVESGAEPACDLWPAVLRRLDAPSAASPNSPRRNWFDWALLAALIVFVASFPATIPVFLYYL